MNDDLLSAMIPIIGHTEWLRRLNDAVTDYAKATSDYGREAAAAKARELHMTEADLIIYAKKKGKPDAI
jgi:hypothetical protein